MTPLIIYLYVSLFSLHLGRKKMLYHLNRMNIQMNLNKLYSDLIIKKTTIDPGC